MPLFSCARQAAGGVLALDACGFARALLDSMDALSVFEAEGVDGYTRDCVEHRVGGLDLHTDGLVMYISWDTPY